MAWPDDRLQHRTRIAFGADVTADPGTWEWTDITSDVPAQSMSITRGRQAAAGAVTPGQTSMVLDNTSGDYTPELATGAHYPHVVVGTPLQESLLGGTTFIELPGSGARISTPSTDDLEFTGDLDVRVDVTLTTWQVPGHHIVLAAKSGADEASWEVGLNEFGEPYVRWVVDSDSGFVVAGLLPVIPPSGRLALRWDVDMDNGDGGLTVTIYTAPTMDGPWAAQGDGTGVTFSGTSQLYPTDTPVQAGAPTAPLYADSVAPVGRLHGLEVRDGIDGTVVASVTAADVMEGAGTFTQGGRAWTVTAPAVATRWVPRITASVASWEPEWPHGDLSTGEDDGDARATVTAAGILQRMGQGASPLQSTLRRRVPSDPDILAYWPCEDGASSTQAASGLPGGTPMRLTGVTWASDDSLAGSDALPATGETAALSASVPAPTGTPEGWHVELVYRVDEAPATDSEIIAINLAGTIFRRLTISVSATSDILIGLEYADESTPDDTATLPAPNAIGDWNRLVMYSRQLTATTSNLHFGIITIGGTVYGTDSATFTGPIGRVTNLTATYGSAIQGLRIGHIGVFATQETTIYNSADFAFDGETAGARLIRLCGEEGLPLLLCGHAADTAPMGPQGLSTLVQLLQECADTDGGILGEHRDRLGLRYRTRTSLYNQSPALSLDAAEDQIANPFRPKLSDQGLTNRVTAQRSGGSSATVDDADSIARSGLYQSQITVNPETDDQLPDIAAWQVHIGTAPGMRYPQITTDLAVAPDVAGDWLAADLGDLLEVTGLPPQHPTSAVQAIVQGTTETFSPTSWTAAANCTPGGVWNVGVIGNADRPPRAGTAGCELAEDASATATTLSVTTTAGSRWCDSPTYPSDFPFDWEVAGERVTVTAITGEGTDQTATVIRSVNGVIKPQAAGAPVRLADRTYTAR